MCCVLIQASQSRQEHGKRPSKRDPKSSDSRASRAEQVFVKLEAIYPADGEVEFSFEELRAIARGWVQKDWKHRSGVSPLRTTTGNAGAQSRSTVYKAHESIDVENLTDAFQKQADLNKTPDSSFSVCDISTQSLVGMPANGSAAASQPTKPKERKTKVREVKQQTQTIKTRLESPTGRKLRRKNSSTAEPTMTFHSKAATNEIYDMFNQPLQKPAVESEDTQIGDDFTEDDGYSTNGESTATGRVSAPSSEFGDDTLAAIRKGRSQSQSQSASVSPWSEFTASKHLPSLSSPTRGSPTNKSCKKSRRTVPSEDTTINVDFSSQNPTQTSGLECGLDTQAIAAIAGGNFEEMDTKAIALLAGDIDVDTDVGDVAVGDEVVVDRAPHKGTPTKVPSTTAGSDFIIHTDADEPLATPTETDFPEQVEIQHKPRFVPLPPVDYEPTPARTYRDPDMVAQNKLPFMTPIAERTESSLSPSTGFNAPAYLDTKTPSKSKYESPSKALVENLLLSSPQQEAHSPLSGSPAKRKHGERGATEAEILTSSPHKKAILQQLEDVLLDGTPLKGAASAQATTRSPLTQIRKGPLVQDLQCNPCDDAVRAQVLASVYPPLRTQKGYFDHSALASTQFPVLKSFAEKQNKLKAKSSPRKSQPVPPVLKFDGSARVYAVKRELGQGAFAPVYLVDSYDPDESQDADEHDKENQSPPSSAPGARDRLEALKAECPPETLVWEFHILRTVKQRLGFAARTMESIVLAHECHLYRDEAFIVLSYSPQGTLLDLVNAARNETIKAGKPAEGLDEVAAMWFAVELFRVVEELHRCGIIHGDLKGDNCLVRFNPSIEVIAPFDPEGNGGWKDRGFTLIDFGRGIDTRMFKPNAQFIADWASCPQDCAEIRECRPWKWQIDYHGLAGIIHSLLFGKYIETTPVSGSAIGPGQRKEWQLRLSFKRYWEKDVWGDLFATLLNPGTVADGEEMPIQRNLKRVRVRMEKWLVEEGERGGRDLRGSLRRMERLAGVR
jgi:checkpoint serine/threonine-protein kinase